MVSHCGFNLHFLRGRCWERQQVGKDDRRRDTTDRGINIYKKTKRLEIMIYVVGQRMARGEVMRT
jgi:hypothetical protein